MIEDRATNFVVHRLREANEGERPPDSLIAVLSQARLAAAPAPGSAVACVPVDDAPGAGSGLDAMVAAILARPGVVSKPPAVVTIGGREGLLLDLELAAGWTAGCLGPEGLVVGVPILNEAGSGTGPAVGLGSDQPVRLILVNIADERTMAIVIVDTGGSALFQAHLVEAMPIVESFAFCAPTR